MKQSISNRLPMSLWVAFIILTIYVIISWSFVRFVHYTAQNRSLEPHTYEVQIITADDYANLSDKSLETVELSDGTSFQDRQPAFYEYSLPNYKAINGAEQYVMVTTVGTSHLYFRWMSDMIPVFAIAAVGLVLATMNVRKHQQAMVAEAKQ